MRNRHTGAGTAQGAHRDRRKQAQTCASGRRTACSHTGVIWFLEKQDNLLVCEIRRAEDDESVYEFEMADATGPKTLRFESATELIAKYLAEHERLAAEGWRPRAGNMTAPE